MKTEYIFNVISAFSRGLARVIPGIIGASLITGMATSANWNASSHIKVRHQLTKLQSLYGNVSPLVGVEVKVSGMSKVGGLWTQVWNNWGTDYTDGNGYFSISETTGSGDRRIKIEVRFKNSDLTIRDAELIDSARWYKVYQADHSSTSVTVGSVFLNRVAFTTLTTTKPGSRPTFGCSARCSWTRWMTTGIHFSRS